MIGAIHDMCYVYGVQVRRKQLGGYFHDQGFHFDGSAVRSFIEKMRAERDGANANQVRQHFAEVLEGDALDIRRAAVGLPEYLSYLLDLHYVVPRGFAPTKQKIDAMSELFPAKVKGKRGYYAGLDRLHTWIAGRICTQEVA
jgi:hypothetical protein